MVPGGGLMYAGYDLNHSYRDTDVFVSLAKLKEHRTAGVTLSMKNCFGITPCTIYSDEAPEDEPSIVPVGYRGPMHSGSRVPPKSAPQPVAESKDPGFRVPRITADLVAARPIHLAVIDGIYTMTGGELPNQEQELDPPGRSSRAADRGHELRLDRRGRDRGDGLRSDGRSRHAAL